MTLCDLFPKPKSAGQLRGYRISRDARLVMESSPIFIHNELLPIVPFTSEKNSCLRADKFFQCEDNLLALGLAQYNRDWSSIKRHYLPVKTLQQIRIRRKNLCAKRAPENVVKYFNQNKVLPEFPKTPVNQGLYGRML